MTERPGKKGTEPKDTKDTTPLPTPTPDIYWESSELVLKVAQGTATPNESRRNDELLRQIMSDSDGPTIVFMTPTGRDLITNFDGQRVVSEGFFEAPARRESRLRRGAGWIFRLLGR